MQVGSLETLEQRLANRKLIRNHLRISTCGRREGSRIGLRVKLRLGFSKGLSKGLHRELRSRIGLSEMTPVGTKRSDLFYLS